MILLNQLVKQFGCLKDRRQRRCANYQMQVRKKLKMRKEITILTSLTKRQRSGQLSALNQEQCFAADQKSGNDNRRVQQTNHFCFCIGATFPQYSLKEPHGHYLLKILRQTQQKSVLQLQHFICLQPETCQMGRLQLGHNRMTGTCTTNSTSALQLSSSSPYLCNNTISFISKSWGRYLVILHSSLPQCSYLFDFQGFIQRKQKQLDLHLELEHFTLLHSMSIFYMGRPHFGHFLVKFQSQLLLNCVVKYLSYYLVRVAIFLHKVQSQTRSQPQCGHLISHCFQEATQYSKEIIDCLPIMCPHGIFATPFQRDISSQMLL